ncbi:MULTISPECIES: ATP-binding protein [unclassified Curtobacterium]|uniref:BbrUII/HgiDII family restriction enzyme n=1 Tax=unclassified Curtobacterium TaxID=257496 RepID=UPI001046FB9D|nr:MULTISPECIES: ATP-binding protein [unclassified Curtobacterium]TCL79928.1 histidine kinase/DNA gyrase B/HSP90-like ATPase [Curtobacterium sp. PhB128]TCL97898.1 histidine kinase/DNA gyrase B/HSP90-like ATPase [Curtobacterium sp. PhB138]
MTSERYAMTLSMNVLRHLGIGLYSNNPAVLSEAVANAWDADASTVQIDIDSARREIIVADDGTGMTLSDVNERFLRVGYQRREDDRAVTASGRPVMGRKGIGKLALFSIADEILVETTTGGQPEAFLLEMKGITEAIGTDDPTATGKYHPVPQDTGSIDFPKGTRLTLRALKNDPGKTSSHLMRRLARRFSIIGPASNFEVILNGEPIEPAQRGLQKMAQYVWQLNGEPSQTDYTNAEYFEHRGVQPSSLRGWIATARDTSKLSEEANGDSLNRIPLLIRGKVAQEDLLDSLNDVGIYRNYLFGEIHADFLDDEDSEDIATSSRQSIREDDERFVALKSALRAELQTIKRQWTELRGKAGVDAALAIPEVKEWYLTLGRDTRAKAERLFRKINQLGLSETSSAELLAQSVLAFELMKQRDNLDALEELDPEDLKSLGKVLTTSADLEAALYHKIVRSRLAVIEKLATLTDSNAKEKFLQEHLFNHVWLLDPGWERASAVTMEQRMATAFAEIADRLSDEERNSRYDIRYQRTSGQHVIIELKRATVVTNTNELDRQIRKYYNAVREWLRDNGRENETVAVVCVVGKPLSDWSDVDGRSISNEQLAARKARVVLYDELIDNARSSYQDYLNANESVGRIQKLLDAIATSSSASIEDDVSDGNQGASELGGRTSLKDEAEAYLELATETH